MNHRAARYTEIAERPITAAAAAVVLRDAGRPVITTATGVSNRLVHRDHPYNPDYDAFGVFGTTTQENIGVSRSSSLKMDPKIPNAS
jgi:hypothetical protein